MDDFLKWLAVAVGIMVVLVVIFALGPSFNFGEKQTKAKIQESLDVTIGPYVVENSKRINIPEFSTVKEVSRRTFGIGDHNVSSGLLTGTQGYSYHFDIVRDYAKSALLSFVVESTNNYGPLKISVNGQTVESKNYQRGFYTIPIDVSMLENSNLLSIIPASSSWRLWAPNHYYLKNITLNIEEYMSKEKSVEFAIEDNEANISEAQIVLYFDTNKGSLDIFVNNEQVFSGLTVPTHRVTINTSLLKPGKNYIELVAGPDSAYEGSGYLWFKYKEKRERGLEKAFQINADDYERFVRGEIAFDVSSVARSGKLIVTLEDPSGAEHQIARETVENGHHSYLFEKSDIGQGVNTLRISSQEGAVFTITSLSINY
ncbi:MAG: hypothetical protein DRO96_03215 [Candidatus Aenigmatarchaeota archaeon]|nr:MAG: hypothetical protein B6U68_02055 [Candidatus Aenigmarchaeota archaeon ex4484_14]RLI96391.1 MAG: hypothetical protein DRO96_03215 [Candidatus Aenigmarchaeota archaeon]